MLRSAENEISNEQISVNEQIICGVCSGSALFAYGPFSGFQTNWLIAVAESDHLSGKSHSFSLQYEYFVLCCPF